MLGTAVQVLGALAVLVVLRDIFHTIYHPAGHGRLSSSVMARAWALAIRLPGSRPRSLAGPLGLLAAVSLWTATLVLGWALVYWPAMPGGFAYGTGLDATQRSGLLDALYLALTTTTTLGFGDIVATTTWLSLATTCSALVGFVLLTSAVSWVLQVYPSLARRRTLAARLELLDRTRAVHRLAILEPSVAATLLVGLSDALVRTRVDLTQNPETYYFHDRQDSTSLPAALGVVLELVDAGRGVPDESVRLGAELLGEAVEDLLRAIASGFLRPARGGEPVADLLARYRDDHGCRAETGRGGRPPATPGGSTPS